jgi:hypothetical protein
MDGDLLDDPSTYQHVVGALRSVCDLNEARHFLLGESTMLANESCNNNPFDCCQMGVTVFKEHS